MATKDEMRAAAMIYADDWRYAEKRSDYQPDEIRDAFQAGAAWQAQQPSNADSVMVGDVGMLERVGKAIRDSDGCGVTIEKKTAFCDDERLEGNLDGYGKPIRRAECHCKKAAEAAIAAIKEPS